MVVIWLRPYLEIVRKVHRIILDQSSNRFDFSPLDTWNLVFSARWRHWGHNDALSTTNQRALASDTQSGHHIVTCNVSDEEKTMSVVSTTSGVGTNCWNFLSGGLIQWKTCTNDAPEQLSKSAEHWVIASMYLLSYSKSLKRHQNQLSAIVNVF